MPLHFYDYEPRDFDECCGIFVSNTPQFFHECELPEYQEYLRDDAAGQYWTVRDDSRLMIACGGVWMRSETEANLCYGMVRTEYRKKGMGSLLLTYRLQKLMANPGLKIIHLDTSQHNPGFFNRFGFATVNTAENHYAPGLHRYDMELAVDDAKRALVDQAYAKLYQDLAA